MIKNESEIKINQNILNKIDKKQRFYRLLSSDLDFKNNYKSISRHTWHSFPAKFPPGLPNFFINNLTEPDDLVLDPMAGSCTTLIESLYLNRRSIGIDIDPLSLILGIAKLQNIDKFKARTTGNSVIDKAVSSYMNDKSTLRNELKNRFDKTSLDFLNYWYSETTQLELIAIIRQIERLEEKKIRDFLKLVFSSIIITKSGGVTLSYDLAHTRPHKVDGKKINSAFVEFNKKMTKILNNGYIDLPEKFKLLEGNAKQLPLADRSVDLIVTSPPYANNAIDYMRAHKFSLIWFEHAINELKLTRRQYIGSETQISEYLTSLPGFTKLIIEKLKAANKNKGKALERYYSEMQQVINEMYRVLKYNSACVIVVATSVLKGVDVQIDKCLSEIGEKAGFEVVKIGTRMIQRDKRMMPASFGNNGKSQIENRMHNEFVIGFWKNLPK